MSALPIQNSSAEREMEHSRVFEEASENGTYFDVFAEAGNARLERADSADHDLDGDTGLGRAVQRVDDLLVDQCVGFQADTGIAACELVSDLVVDPLDDPAANPVRRNEKVAVARLSGVSGQRVEEVGEVSTDLPVLR